MNQNIKQFKFGFYVKNKWLLSARLTALVIIIYFCLIVYVFADTLPYHIDKDNIVIDESGIYRIDFNYPGDTFIVFNCDTENYLIFNDGSFIVPLSTGDIIDSRTILYSNNCDDPIIKTACDDPIIKSDTKTNNKKGD